MKKSIITMVAGVTIASSAVAQNLTSVPVHDKPVWQQVQSMPQSPGTAVAVRSLATNQVIGALPVDYKFLAFGTDGQITTLGFNGEVAYVPSAAAGPLYPQIPKPEIPPAGPDTLEDLAEAYEEKVTGQATVSLRPKNSIVNEVSDRQAALTMMGTTVQAVDPMAGMMPYAGQPGAALATGGVGGVGAMVGGAAGGYGNQPGYFPNAGYK